MHFKGNSAIHYNMFLQKLFVSFIDDDPCRYVHAAFAVANVEHFCTVTFTFPMQIGLGSAVRQERVVSLSVELLSTLAMMVVLFHWLGYLGGEKQRWCCFHFDY